MGAQSTASYISRVGQDSAYLNDVHQYGDAYDGASNSQYRQVGQNGTVYGYATEMVCFSFE